MRQLSGRAPSRASAGRILHGRDSALAMSRPWSRYSARPIPSMLARATGWPCQIDHLVATAAGGLFQQGRRGRPQPSSQRRNVAFRLLAQTRRARASQRAAGDVADVEERIGAGRTRSRRTTRSRAQCAGRHLRCSTPSAGSSRRGSGPTRASAHSSVATRPSADRTADISTAVSDTPTARSMSAGIGAVQAA